MLDIGLKVMSIRQAVAVNRGFNPCYVGYRSESHKKWLENSGGVRGFNPCYVGYRSERASPSNPVSNT